MKKIISIIICSIFLIGCSANYRTRVEANKILTEEKNRIERAINLAKHSYALLWKMIDPPYDEYTEGCWTNHCLIKKIIRNTKGPIHITGWKATKRNNQTYTVCYLVESISPCCYCFDVNLEAEIVRCIE